MSEERLTFKEMCAKFDVTPRTLRFYEAKELLAPERRGTKRLFTRRDRDRLPLNRSSDHQQEYQQRRPCGQRGSGQAKQRDEQ